jgi:pimeloyl-ACP methyl ester carboxylesterase
VTDYLLVHGAGQGAWTWSKVWGYMTAPAEHPPRLYAYRKVGKVFPMDLPGHGTDANGDTSAVQMEECVQAIVRAVERQELRDVVLVGHGFAAAPVLQAVAELPAPPKRVVLIAGIVPGQGKSMLSELSMSSRSAFKVLSLFNSLAGKDVKLPKGVISQYLCNGVDTMEVVQTVGFFGALPTRVLRSGVNLGDLSLPCPVTYIVLSRDRVIPPDAQRRMAQRIPNVELMEFDSCHQVTLYRPKELADTLASFA